MLTIHNNAARGHAGAARAPRGACRAFTLVEILCVVVILGIASAIIIPQMGSRDDLRAAAGARLVISDLMYAQNLAISRQRKHYIQFVGNQYMMLSRNVDTDPLLVVTHPVSKNPYVTTFNDRTAGLDGVTLDPVNFGGGGATILGFDDLGEPFYYNGAVATPLTAPATIVVRSGNHSLTVSIEPFTGDASVN